MSLDEEEDGDNVDILPVPKSKRSEAVYWQTAQIFFFFESLQDRVENVFQFTDKTEEIVEWDASEHQLQTKLTDFFL